MRNDKNNNGEEDLILPHDVSYNKIVKYGTIEDEDTSSDDISISVFSSSDESGEGSVGKGLLDSSWCIVVLASSFLCLCVLDGVTYTFGVFLPALMEDLEGGRGEVSAAGSFQVGVYSFTSLVAARLVSTHGPRPICMIGALLAACGLATASLAWDIVSLLGSYSLMTGIGFGLMYVPAVVAVAQHFTERRALALGVCVCGSGVGTFILAPLEHYLLLTIGWRTTFLCLAGVCFLCLFCGAVMTPTEKFSYGQLTDDQDLLNASYSSPTLQSSFSSCISTSLSIILSPELLASPALVPFLLIAGADCVATMGLFIPFTFLPDEAHSAGISTDDAAFLVAVMGISSALGRLIAGWLCDQPRCNPLAFTALSVGAAAVAPLLFPWISSYSTYLLLSAFFGLVTGMWIAASSPMLVRILGLSLLSPAFGLMTAFQGAAALSGPPLAGMAIDWLGDKGVAFHLAGAILASAALVFFAVYKLHALRYGSAT